MMKRQEKVFCATLAFLFILGSFAIETIQAATASLEPISGYYWKYGQSAWSSSALNSSEISSICDEDSQSVFQVQSTAFDVPEPYGHEISSPCVIIGFDARSLVDPAGMSIPVTVTVRAEHLVTDSPYPLISLRMFAPAEWSADTNPWDRSQYDWVHMQSWSWDTSTNPEFIFSLGRRALSPNGFLYLNIDGGQWVGGCSPTTTDTVNVYTLTVTGEVVPEPATILLLSLGGLILRKKR